MSGNIYTKISSNARLDRYYFVSEGKSRLNKIVKFELINEAEQIYNLVLCTMLNDGSTDCETSSRNGDMNIVLETVAQIAKIFSDQYPERKIFLAGSEVLRKRQYQIKISFFLNLINDFFEVEGVMLDNFEFIKREPFAPDVKYDAFIFTRKPV